MNSKIKKSVFIALSVVLALISFVFYIPNAISSHNSVDISELNSWYYTDENGKRVDITLPDKLHQNDKGDIIIKTDLPENFPDRQTLCFWTFYQSVEVFADDSLIYSYDNSDSSFGEASSSQWNFVEMPDSDLGGKVLTVKMNTPYSDINLRFTEFVYGHNSQVREWLHNKYDIYQAIELSFIAIGLFMIAMVIIVKLPKNVKRGQFFSGCVFIVFSIYVRTGTKNLPIHWLNSYTQEMLYFFSLIFLAIPFALYIRSRVLDRKKMVIWCEILVSADLIIGITAFTLHGLGIIDIHRIMTVCCIPLFLAIITSVVFCIIYAFKTKPKRKIAIASLVSSLIILIFFVFEYLQFYQINTLPFDTGFLSHIGAIIVIFIETSIQVTLISNELKARNEVESENRSLQIQLLTDQIRPHFLLNTVGAIRTLIYDDPDKASELLYEFSRYFRKNFEQKDYSKPIPFPQELDYISTYLKLEKARLGDKITVEYDIQTREFWVLPLTIQPFVENAVKHGIFPASYPGVLKIATKRLNEATLIEISDNGIGMNVDELDQILGEKKSVGIRSAKMRLTEQLDADIRFISNTEPGNSGTTVQIVIPARKRITK
jgi:signal transduction histidine kinase